MNLGELRRSLMAWYERHARDLPWRRRNDPYAVWVSEIMLQQTQAATVAPYFERFMVAFPTLEALAAAPLHQVLKAWEGLGYYRRARHLHRAAQIVADQYGGQIPAAEPALLALPGIGRYTAGAIRSIAFDQPAPILDGNVKRVLSRLDDLDQNIDDPAVERRLWVRAADLVDPDQPGAFNQALMELGATVCLPQSPRCLVCPLQTLCLACARGAQHERPVRSPRRRIPHYDVVAGVVWHAAGDGRFLISQRPADGMLGGLWEFPGGKQQPGESQAAALMRELREELDIEVEVGQHLASIDHAYTHFRITLHAFHAWHSAGSPRCLGVDDWRWVTLADLDDYAFARTDRKIIDALGGG